MRRSVWKLAALNLVLVLLVGVLSPLSALAANDYYEIWIGDYTIFSNQEYSVPDEGWYYDPFYHELTLTDQYPGYSIYAATGDLSIYTDGHVQIRGRDSGSQNVYGESGISVGGRLKLYSTNGSLTVTGGNVTGSHSPDAKLYGGHGIFAAGGMEYIGNDASLTVTGGQALNGYGGYGIAANDDAPIGLYSSYYVDERGDDSVQYLGRVSVTDQITVTGGRGVLGGNAIDAGEIWLDTDGTVTGGATVTSYPHNAGSALRCYWYQIGSDSTDTSVNLTLQAGSSQRCCVYPIGTGPADALVGDHILTEESKTDPFATPYSLTFYPKSYYAVFNGMGGTPVPGSQDTQYAQYPTSIDLSQTRYTKPGHYLYGYLDATPKQLIMAHDIYVPYADCRLEAQWAPYDQNTVLFLGNYGTVEGNHYATRPTGSLVAPTATTTHSRSHLLGWCSNADPIWDSTTGRVGADALWLDPGQSCTVDQQTVLWAIREYPFFCTLLYHGNGGTLANGSTTAVKTTYSTASSLSLYVGDDQGFQREGYRFAGWYSAGTGGQRLPADHSICDRQQLEVYARWEKLTTTIRFDSVKPGAQTFAAFYDSNHRLLQVMDTKGSGTVEVPNALYDTIHEARLFQLDPSTHAPLGAYLSHIRTP